MLKVDAEKSFKELDVVLPIPAKSRLLKSCRLALRLRFGIGLSVAPVLPIKELPNGINVV